MNNRRDFFKNLIGSAGTSEGKKTENKIPLNRLKELPEKIVLNIEPVLFPQNHWKLKDNAIFSFENSTDNKYSLDTVEKDIFNHFSKSHKLFKIIQEISDAHHLTYSDSYKKVTSLFFALASMRVCHPREVYNIDEIINSENNLAE
jgi:hypothetical protein